MGEPEAEPVNAPGTDPTRRPGAVSRRTLLVAVLALAVGLGGTLGVSRLLSHGPATTAATAQYLPALGAQPEPAPDFSLPDQAGQLVSMSALRGRLVLVTFLDPQCKSQCPILGQQLGSVESRLPASVKPVLLVVSVAPDRTAADVSTFVSHVSWQPGWHWLLGNQAELQAVWALYHVAVQPGATDVAHDVVVYIVNAKGLIVTAYNAPLPIDEVVASITKDASA
ncbi:MAG TPA: SCO family protein [Candidatus Dormibacteraeota bacterium]